MIQARSLQGRLLVLVIGVVVGVWLIAALFIWRDAHKELDELLDSHLAQAAALLVVQQTQSIDDDDAIDWRVPHPYAPKVVFQIFHEGQAVVRSASAPTEPMIPADRDIDQGFATVQINGEAWRVFSMRVQREDTRVYVGERVDSRTAILLAVLRGALWPMAVALPLFGIATGWAVRQGLAPLKRLGRTIAQRAPNDLAPVVMPQTPAEMSPLLDALNQLFIRIQTVWEAERRFTADAAHELRTPIAAIRTQAQVALAETDDTLRQHALRATLEGCDRATRLVNQLLILSRLETGATLELTKVDLSALAQRVAAELAPAAIAKRQSLEFEGEENCHITGDETLLAALVRNLVDNAIRYSPPGASVLIRTKTNRDLTMLSVEDSGPGVADADRLKLGERFFRVSGTAESGSGLGWSIVQRIVDLHAAVVNVRRSSALGGLEVQITWHAR